MIMIDVDLTLVDSLSPWLRWFKARTGVELNPTSYGLEGIMQEHMNDDPLEYWRQPNVYDNLKPYGFSVRTIRKLREEGFQVVFVTHSPYPEQIGPKEAWLDWHYDKGIPVIHTEHKELIDADIMIDDNIEMLEKFLNHKAGRVGLKFDTQLNKGWYAPYPQKSLTMSHWPDIQEYFQQHYGVQF